MPNLFNLYFHEHDDGDIQLTEAPKVENARPIMRLECVSQSGVIALLRLFATRYDVYKRNGLQNRWNVNKNTVQADVNLMLNGAYVNKIYTAQYRIGE